MALIMQTRTRSEIEAELDLAEGQFAEAPQDTINRLRHCFPNLPERDLLAMALRHPDVAGERASWRLRIRALRRALAALA